LFGYRPGAFLLVQDEISGSLRLPCGDDGKPLVVLQNLQPALNIRRAVL
jgi:hypothetical protein